MTIGDKIREARIAKGITQEGLAKVIKATKQTIYKYETGIVTNIPLSKIELIAETLNIPVEYLMGWDKNIKPLPRTKKLPLYGAIACGTPILCTDNVEKEISCPEDLNADFCLTCRGDSMIGARINDGDIVFIRKQPDVDDGQIAAVMIPVSEGEAEATLKRVYHAPDGSVILQAENAKYPPVILKDAEIIGLAVSFYSNIK